MNESDKRIKQSLRDIGQYFIDASKRWPNYPEIARVRFRGGLRVARIVAPSLGIHDARDECDVDTRRADCPTCLGTGTVVVENMEGWCPTCGGATHD